MLLEMRGQRRCAPRRRSRMASSVRPPPRRWDRCRDRYANRQQSLRNERLHLPNLYRLVEAPPPKVRRERGAVQSLAESVPDRLNGIVRIALYGAR